jgi:hypothetical protein
VPLPRGLLAADVAVAHDPAAGADQQRSVLGGLNAALEATDVLHIISVPLSTRSITVASSEAVTAFACAFIKMPKHKDVLPSVFVRGLPPSATDESLVRLFSNAAPVKRAFVIRDRATKESKGFAFVQL